MDMKFDDIVKLIDDRAHVSKYTALLSEARKKSNPNQGEFNFDEPEPTAKPKPNSKKKTASKSKPKKKTTSKGSSKKGTASKATPKTTKKKTATKANAKPKPEMEQDAEPIVYRDPRGYIAPLSKPLRPESERGHTQEPIDQDRGPDLNTIGRYLRNSTDDSADFNLNSSGKHYYSEIYPQVSKLFKYVDRNMRSELLDVYKDNDSKDGVNTRYTDMDYMRWYREISDLVSNAMGSAGEQMVTMRPKDHSEFSYKEPAPLSDILSTEYLVTFINNFFPKQNDSGVKGNLGSDQVGTRDFGVSNSAGSEGDMSEAEVDNFTGLNGASPEELMAYAKSGNTMAFDRLSDDDILELAAMDGLTPEIKSKAMNHINSDPILGSRYAMSQLDW